MKMVKQIVLMAFASLLAQSVWAAIGDTVTWANLESSEPFAFQFTKNSGDCSLTLTALDGCPAGATVAVSTIAFPTNNKTFPDSITINETTSSERSVTTWPEKTYGNYTLNQLVTYTFSTPILANVGTSYSITTVNSAKLPMTGIHDASVIDLPGLSGWADYNTMCSVSGTVYAINYTFDATTQTWSPYEPTVCGSNDTLAYTGAGNAEVPTGFTACAITIGSGVTLTNDGTLTGNVTIAQNAALKLTAGTISKSKVTNNGKIIIAGGTTDNPVVIVEDGGKDSGIGVVEVASGAVLKSTVSRDTNRRYNITGAEDGTSTVILHNTTGWGMTDGTAIRNCNLSFIGADFWLEREGAFDASVNLEIPSGRVLHTNGPGTSFEIGKLSGSGTITPDGNRSLKVNVAEGAATTFGGTSGAGLTIVKKGAGELAITAAQSGTVSIEEGIVKPTANAANGKTFVVSENGTVLFNNDSDASGFDSNDLSKITGTGKIKFTGNGYVAIPYDDSGKLWASTLEVVNEKKNALLLKDAKTYTIGSLSGSGKFRFDWGSNKRTLVVKQSKNTTWTGSIFVSAGHKDSRYLDIEVKSDNDSVLTVSGNDGISTQRATLIAGQGGTIKSASAGKLGDGTIKINGGTIELNEAGFSDDGKGYTIVSDGGTIKKTVTDGNAYSKIIKSLTLNADTAINGKINGIGTHSTTAGTLSLGSHTLTVTMDEPWDQQNGYGNFYFYNTAISGDGAIKVTKGNLLVHTAATTATDAMIEIGENASIQVDGSGSLSVKNLYIKKHNNKNFNGTLTVTGTLTLDDNFPVSKATLAEGAKVTTTLENKYVKVIDNVYTICSILPPEPPTPTAGGITPNIPGAETIVITVATGPGEETISGTTIPLETGLYTVKGKVGETVVGTQNIGVVAAKDAETTTDRVTTAVAVPFKGKTVDTLLNTTLLAEGDTLMAWVKVGEKSGYATWKLTSGAWVGENVVNGIAAQPATTVLKCGQAVWVTTAGKIVTFGDTAATGDTVEVTTGHNLLGSIAYTDAEPSAIDTDQVQLIGEVDKDGNEIITRYNKTSTGWQSKIQTRTQLSNGKWVTTEETSNEAPTVKPGRGYWLIRK